MSLLFLVGPLLVSAWHLASTRGPSEAAARLDAEAGDEAVASPWTGDVRMPFEAAPENVTPPAEVTAPPLAIALWSEHGIVLANDVPEGWATGPWLAEASDDRYDVWVARRRAALDRLPEAFVGLGGTLVDVYGMHGRVCAGKLGALEVVAASDGEFSNAQALADAGEPIDRVRSAVFRDEERWLVATLEPVWGDCADGVYARSAELPAPVSWTRREDEGVRADVPATLERRFRAKATARLRTDYERYAADIEQGSGVEETPPTWREFYEGTFEVEVFADETHTPRVWWLRVGEEEACQVVFGGRLDELLSPEGEVLPRGAGDPLVFVDAQGDGTMQTIAATYGGYVLLAPDGSEQASTVRPFHGCPC